jgi:hypothetical protein
MAMYEISIKIVFAFCMFYNRNFDKKREIICNCNLNSIGLIFRLSISSNEMKN